MVTTDASSAAIAETNAALTASGTLTIVDSDPADTVTLSVAGVISSGVTTGYTNITTSRLSMLTVTGGTLPADAGNQHTVGWTFASTPETFD